MKFKVSPHTSRPGVEAVEIWSDQGKLIGAIYPQPRGVKIVSKYIRNTPDLLLVEVQNPPAILVNLVDSASHVPVEGVQSDGE